MSSQHWRIPMRLKKSLLPGASLIFPEEMQTVVTTDRAPTTDGRNKSAQIWFDEPKNLSGLRIMPGRGITYRGMDDPQTTTSQKIPTLALVMLSLQLFQSILLISVFCSIPSSHSIS